MKLIRLEILLILLEILYVEIRCFKRNEMRDYKVPQIFKCSITCNSSFLWKLGFRLFSLFNFESNCKCNAIIDLKKNNTIIFIYDDLFSVIAIVSERDDTRKFLSPDSCQLGSDHPCVHRHFCPFSSAFAGLVFEDKVLPLNHLPSVCRRPSAPCACHCCRELLNMTHIKIAPVRANWRRGCL